MNAYYEDGTPVEGYNSSSQTPLFYDKYYDRSNQKNYLSLIGGLKWEIIDGLTANVQGSFFRTDSKTKQFIKANVFDATRKSSWGPDHDRTPEARSLRLLQEDVRRRPQLLGHGGYSYQKRDYETVSVAGSGGTSDKVTTINGSSSSNPTTSPRRNRPNARSDSSDASTTITRANIC